MPETVLMGVTVNTTASGTSGAWVVDINAEDPARLGWLVTVDGDDDAIAAASSRSRVDRWALQLDLGAGLESINPTECSVLTIGGSLDDWADQCSFELYGQRFSPDVMGAMRGLVPCVVTETIGEPSAPIVREQFRGVIISAAYDPATRTTRCEALDDVARIAETNIAPYLEPSSGKTRDGHALEIFAAAGATVGRVDSGVNGAKVIKKPLSKVDTLLVEFMRDWYEPCGAWLYKGESGINIERWSDTRNVAAVLTPNDCVTLPAFTPPAALAPNKITVVAINYDRLDSTGSRTVSFTTTTFEDYAIKGAVAKQDKTTGTVSVVAYGDAVAQNRRVRAVTTTQTMRGNLLVMSEVTEYGWSAQKTARLQVETDGTTVNHLDDYDCYQFEDGNWYRDRRERWGVIRNTRIVKTLTGNYVTGVSERRAFRHFAEHALFSLAGGPPPTESVLAGGPWALTEDGRGVDPPYEVKMRIADNDGSPFLVPDELITKVFTIDGDGYLLAEEETSYAYTLGARASSQSAGTTVQGFDASSKTYWNANNAILRETGSRSTTYQPVDEDNYLQTEVIRETETNMVEYLPTVQGRGPRPRPEELLPQSRSQEIRNSVTDEIREFLAGKTIEDYVQSEYCQDDEDVSNLAVARLQMESAWPGSVVVPHSHVIRKGQYVSFSGFAPWGIQPDPKRALVWSYMIDCRAKTKTLGLKYLPPEVDRT